MPKKLTTKELISAATNDPALSEDDFILGDRKFKLVDLSYDDYLTFMVFLEPLVQAVMGGLAARANIPGIDLSTSLTAASLLTYCRENLPEMVCLVCRQTDSEITVEEIKRLAKTPFALANIVLRQVAKNGIIKDFADFFRQAIPVLKGLTTA